ncbi:hypothetical protein [Devosia oryzisoli]|jgi:hypothetical protein|nr:hypothetical protein [Devosia oryzisoli]
MRYGEKTGLEFIEGFAMLAGAVWIMGAAFAIALAWLGHGRV